MTPLNLPKIDFNIKQEGEKTLIFDIIRKKYIVLTPEEWVRQHFLHFLINAYQYPKSLIKVESGLTYNRLAKRCDILIYDRDAKPFMLVECKSHQEKISQKTFNQAAMYNSKMKCKYFTVTNGMQHFCCSMDYSQNKFLFLKDIPLFQ